MALPETKQGVTILQKATRIALLVPEHASADAFASMMALYLVLLECHNGEVDAVSPSHVHSQWQFLPGSSQTHTALTVQPEIVIDVAQKEPVTNVRYTQLNGGTRVHLEVDKAQDLSMDDVEVHIRRTPYDAAVVFGAADLEALGALFNEHTDFFYNTPIINVDNKSNNEHFGTVNIVDITSSSIAEITQELIVAMPGTSLSGNIATALYAGIIDATESFQSPSTNPKAFEAAAKLLNQKADKDVVIQNLVKTKPLSILKLAGRVYARLRNDEYGKIFWSVLRDADFTESAAKREDIPTVMHELLHNISEYNAACIVYANGTSHTAYISLGKGLAKKKRDIARSMEAPVSDGFLVLPLHAPSLEAAEQELLDSIRPILP